MGFFNIPKIIFGGRQRASVKPDSKHAGQRRDPRDYLRKKKVRRKMQELSRRKNR